MAVDTGTVTQTPLFDRNKVHGMCKSTASVHNSGCRVRCTNPSNLHLRTLSASDIMEVAEPLGVSSTVLSDNNFGCTNTLSRRIVSFS